MTLVGVFSLANCLRVAISAALHGFPELCVLIVIVFPGCQWTLKRISALRAGVADRYSYSRDTQTCLENEVPSCGRVVSSRLA